MPAPNLIGGQLPWGQAAGGANLFQGMGGTPQQSAAALGPNYANAYTSALAMNQQNYGNILAGYQQTAAQHADAADSIAGGYTGLTNSVLDRIKGIGQAAQANLGEQYNRASGLASQGLINRGLSNTTVANSVQAGIERDRSRAMVDLQDTQANRLAGYESQLGQAALGSRQHNTDQALNLSQNQLGWMNSVSAGYPNAGMYGQLAEQFGRTGQANADREQALRLGGGGGPDPRSAGIPPATRGGGAGFFDNPTHDLGAGGYTPPPLGGMFSGPGSSAYTGGMFNITGRPNFFGNSGVLGGGGQPAGGQAPGLPYAPPQSGFGGGFGGQNYGGGDVSADEAMYGNPNASAGPYQPYGAGNFGSTQPIPGQEQDPWALANSFFEGF